MITPRLPAITITAPSALAGVSARRLSVEVLRAITSGHARVSLDCGFVERVDSYGLHVLTGAQRAAHAAGVILEIINPTLMVYHHLQRTSLAAAMVLAGDGDGDGDPEGNHAE